MRIEKKVLIAESLEREREQGCESSPIVRVVTSKVEMLAKNVITDQKKESLARSLSSFFL